MTPETEDENVRPMLETQADAKQNSALRGVRSGWLRRTLLLAGCAILLFSTGCGINALIGDGIPPGTSKLVGKVLAADNAQQPLANLNVTVSSTATGQATVSYRVTTDAQGLFTVKGIVTGKHQASGPLSVSNVVVSVDPAKTPYQTQKISLLLTEGRATEVVVALPPTSFDVSQVGQVSITAPAASANGVTTGSPFQFTARMLDRNNMPLISAQTGNYLVPSLVLDGFMVTGVGSNGTFEATGALIGISSITGQVSVPGADQPVNSPRLDLPVQPASNVSTGHVAQKIQ